MRIFLPTGVFLLICAIYSGYWLWASDRMENLVIEWADEQRTAGNEVSWSSLKMRGYPFRLEAHVSDPVIRARDWTWQGDRFVVHMMPYSFSHYIGTFEGTNRIRLGAPGAGRPLIFDGEATRARASLVFEKKGALRVSVDLAGLAANRLDARGEAVLSRFAADRLQLHMRQWLDREDGRDVPRAMLAIAVQADNANVPTHRLKGLGPVIDLARGQILVSELPLELAGDPESLAAWLRAWESNGGQARLEGFDLHWDDIEMSASGRLQLDDRGRPQGVIDARISGHDAVVDVLRSNELVNGDQADAVKNALAALNLVSRDKQGRLKLPVKLKKGDVYLGPVKLSRVEPVY